MICNNHNYLPEPHDLFAISSIVSVNRVLLPVCQIDLLHSTQHHLHQFNFFIIIYCCLSGYSTAYPIHTWHTIFVYLFVCGLLNTSSSLASKYCRYCWGRTSLNPSKNACVCSSTPLDSLHSATSLQTTMQKHKLNEGNTTLPLFFSLISEGLTLDT